MTIESSKEYKLTVSESELNIIRIALCNYSMKQLLLAFDTIKESEEKGLPDSYSHIYYELRDQTRSIIADIDSLSE